MGFEIFESCFVSDSLVRVVFHCMTFPVDSKEDALLQAMLAEGSEKRAPAPPRHDDLRSSGT